MTKAPTLQPSLEETVPPSKYFDAKTLADFTRVLDQKGTRLKPNDG